jgi:hypothetical protein
MTLDASGNLGIGSTSTNMFVHHYQSENSRGEPCYIAAFGRPLSEQSDIRRWCYQTYGTPGYRYDDDLTVWKDNIAFGEIEFARESDLSLFLLKWK